MWKKQEQCRLGPSHLLELSFDPAAIMRAKQQAWQVEWFDTAGPIAATTRDVPGVLRGVREDPACSVDESQMSGLFRRTLVRRRLQGLTH
eukprot:8319485-Pyramimonas_sp.AAC.1